MKITITATLTEEELSILAYNKGYVNTITEYEDVETPYEAYTIWGIDHPAWVYIVQKPVEKSNPQTPQDYVRQVYEGIIIADATNIFTEYRSVKLKEQQKLLEEAVRESVTSSITSTID